MQMSIERWFSEYWDDSVRHYGEYTINNRDYAHKMIEDFKEGLGEQKIVIWGAGTIGSRMISLFKELKLDVLAVIDNKKEKIEGLDDIEVLSPEAGREFCDEKVCIFVAVNYRTFDSVRADIQSRKMKCAKIINAYDVYFLLQSAICMIKSVDVDKKIILSSCRECPIEMNNCSYRLGYLKRKLNYKEKTGKSKKLNDLAITLGSVCTLKCKNCIEAVPYCKEKGFEKKDEILMDLVTVASACDFISVLEVVGGEPLLHPELGEIINGILKIENIGSIALFTNGTVSPNKELLEVLSNERIEVYISNYDKFISAEQRTKVRNTIEAFKKNNIQYVVGKNTNWLECAGFKYQNRDKEKLVNSYKDCYLRNCHRMYRGTIYVCPYQFAGVRLGKLRRNNVIQIYDEKESLESKLENISRFEYIEACKYCSFPHDARLVDAGEQL